MKQQPPPPSESPILQAAKVLFGSTPGTVVEVRVPKAGREGVISGYFDNFERLAHCVANLEKRTPPLPGIYWTLNPVDPSFIKAPITLPDGSTGKRSANQVRPFTRHTTDDRDIMRRVWLPIDVDPKRETDVSSTDEEHEGALELAKTIREALSAEEWPASIFADSGNGAHLLYRIDLPNDEPSRQLVDRVLKALAHRFDVPNKIEVDTTMSNASRICKIYGTTARKGESTSERPHRMSRILSAPAMVGDDFLPVEFLEEFARQWFIEPPKPPQPQYPQRHSHSFSGPSTFSIEAFLARYGIGHKQKLPYNGGWKYQLDVCPWNPAHTGTDAVIFEMASGAIVFHCSHKSCSGRDWPQFREIFEPRSQRRQARPRSDDWTDPKTPTWGEISGESPAPSMPAPEPEPPPEPELSDADIHAAVDAAIEAKDLISAIRMAPDVAKLPVVEQVVIKVKLKQGFGREWPATDFDKALRDATSKSDVTGHEKSDRVPPGDGGGNGEAVDSDPGGPDLRQYALTDAGNGERIVALHGQNIRYCIEMKSWLVWDGKRWAVDAQNVMRLRTIEAARLLNYQAVHLETSEARRAALEKHAKASESSKAMTNALLEASVRPGIPIHASELDQHPMLLNCPNGIIDLRSGKLLPHCREFLITKVCPVEFDPDAKCPQFLAWLEWAMGHGGANPDAEVSEETAHLIGFLQRALGYSLTANVGEKCIFVCYGDKGNNGKTTLLTLFRSLLGTDYSGELGMDTLMSQKTLDATMRADLADLRGVRFAQTSEVEKEHRLKEGQLKYLTAGMGTIKSCRKYENPIVFSSSHKIWMDCNHRPQVKGVDEAIWRRLKCIPFEMRVDDDKIDTKLPDRLAKERPGILAWAVRGCLEWQKFGLGDPPEIAKANLLWRENDDPLKDFLEDCCIIADSAADGLFVGAKDIGIAYELWCKDNRQRFPIGGTDFRDRLRAKGFEPNRRRDENGKQFRCWEGLELSNDVLTRVRRADKSGTQPGFREDES